MFPSFARFRRFASKGVCHWLGAWRLRIRTIVSTLHLTPIQYVNPSREPLLDLYVPIYVSPHWNENLKQFLYGNTKTAKIIKSHSSFFLLWKKWKKRILSWRISFFYICGQLISKTFNLQNVNIIWHEPIWRDSGEIQKFQTTYSIIFLYYGKSKCINVCAMNYGTSLMNRDSDVIFHSISDVNRVVIEAVCMCDEASMLQKVDYVIAWRI